ncbi:Tf2-8, partial [Mucuna pruriens]
MVAVDYFTKWVEAEPMATITVERVKCFIWKKIICRFGLPAEIVSDNGTQFASSATAKFCQELHIRQSFTSVEHPQANGQVEAANRVILRGLRRRLEEAKGRWAEELLQVLWSYHTTPHSTTGETLFRLTYGSEVVIPVEIGEPSPKTALFEPTANEDELRANLDLLQEIREIAHIKEYAVKTRVARKYDRRVVYRDFQEGDLVLRKATLGAEKNKLTPKWEGPFKIAEKVGRGAYRLEHLDRRRIPRTWNASSLRRPKTDAHKDRSGVRRGKLQDPKRTRPIRGPKREATRPKTDGHRDRSGVRRGKLQDPKRTAIETDPGSQDEATRPKTDGHRDRSGVRRTKIY